VKREVCLTVSDVGGVNLSTHSGGLDAPSITGVDGKFRHTVFDFVDESIYGGNDILLPRCRSTSDHAEQHQNTSTLLRDASIL